MVFVVELSAAQVWFHYSFPMCHTSDSNSWLVSLGLFTILQLHIGRKRFERCAAVSHVVANQTNAHAQ